MSDLPRPRHMAALEAALLGASPAASPNRELRATDEVFGNLHLLNHYQRLTDDEASGTGAFQQVIEDLERQREWLRAVGEPHRYQSFASEFDRPPSDPDKSTLRKPEDPSPIESRSFAKVSFPRNKFGDLEDKFRSLEPGLIRKRQYEAVRNSPEFARYHLTDRVLLDAAKVVRVPRGRPCKPKQT